MESTPTSAPPLMGKRRRRRSCRSSGEDRISGLPDELVHAILVRLNCARAAARTSVLSRRWRHVWRHLPELFLNDLNYWPEVFPNAPPASFLDTVDRALAGYSAPTLERLSIMSTDCDLRIPAGRIAPWLRFAAEHMVGNLYLSVLVEPKQEATAEEAVVLELPVLQAAKEISVRLANTYRLRLQEPGLFAALTFLRIHHGRMEGTELTAVCTQCPRLRDLVLLFSKLIGVPDISVHSNSLHSLTFAISNVQRLEVVAPRLEELTVLIHPMEAHVSAPKLAKVAWSGQAYYHPGHHRFADVSRHLRRLQINHKSFSASLIRQFDEVDELQLEIFISQGAAGYGSFLNETNKLPKCKTFMISLAKGHHALLPTMLHLFRSCYSTDKCSVELLNRVDQSSNAYSCLPFCPCLSEERCNIDGIALSSLEELEIRGFTDCPEMLELVENISCSAAILKRLVINYARFPAPPLTKEVCEKVRSLCHPNVKVKFYVYNDWKRIRFD